VKMGCGDACQLRVHRVREWEIHDPDRKAVERGPRDPQTSSHEESRDDVPSSSTP